MKVRPINDYIYCRKCISADEEEFNGSTWYRRGNIVVTNATADVTNFAEIMSVGPGCKYFTNQHIGMKLMCPEISNGLHRVSEEDFMVKESSLQVMAAFE